MRFSFLFMCFLALGLAGCAETLPRRSSTSAPSGPTSIAVPATSAPSAAEISTAAAPAPIMVTVRPLVVFVPQTETSAISSLTLFERYPLWRMVLAVSPRFHKLAKDPVWQGKITDLQQKGRLELALQIPNAPILPLLINTDSAAQTLPPTTLLPQPPYTYINDAVQIVARAKGDFQKVWGKTAKGLALPYGAINPATANVVHRLGFDWGIASLAISSGTSAAYRSGSFVIWDGAADIPQPHNYVLDERIMADPAKSMAALSHLAQEIQQRKQSLALPSDPDISIEELPKDQLWGGRTLNAPDWSAWVGTPAKSVAWEALRKTRDMLEHYKNSGKASVQRLDMVAEQIFTAENANFIGVMGDTNRPTLAEEREREFKATLLSAYRLMGENPPEDLFDTDLALQGVPVQASTAVATASWQNFPDGTGHLSLVDGAGDERDNPAAGLYDLRRVDLVVSSTTLDWAVTLGSAAGHGQMVDIYMDLNGQPHLGTAQFLPGRGMVPSPINAWEYALVLTDHRAFFYRTRGEGTYELAETLPVRTAGERMFVQMPKIWLRGNPQRWFYQVLVAAQDITSQERDPIPAGAVKDFLDPPGGIINPLPFIHVTR